MICSGRAEALEPDCNEPLADVLARVRRELEDIAGRIDRNQALIARSTWAYGADDEDYVRAMQDADLSAQRIAGIAGYLRAIADAAHPQWQIETGTAAATLTLAEMVRTIGTALEAGEAQDAPEGGDVDFF